jgi:hypothetical protein
MFAFTFTANSYNAACDYAARKGGRCKVTYLINGFWLAERI